MPNLSDLIGGNLQFASVALTGAPNANSQTFPSVNYFKVPFNAKFADPYSICTLNTSLSTITLPAGLYSIEVSPQGLRTTVANILINTRITVNGVSVTKWPKYRLTTAVANTVADSHINLTAAGIYLASSSSVALEQYWAAASGLLGTDIDDSSSNVYYKMDIWKLR